MHSGGNFADPPGGEVVKILANFRHWPLRRIPSVGLKPRDTSTQNAPERGARLLRFGNQGRFWAAFVSIILLVHHPATGEAVGTLSLNRGIERRLAGNQTHTYQFALKPGQFVHVVVNQKGIDVVLTLIDPNSRRLVELDRWSDLQGPESVSWIAESSGVYELEIRAARKQAPWGTYEAKITELRGPTPADRIRIAAERAYAEGDELNNQGTEDSQRNSIGKLEEALQLWNLIGDRLWEATTLLYIGVTYYGLAMFRKHWTIMAALWFCGTRRSRKAARP